MESSDRLRLNKFKKIIYFLEWFFLFVNLFVFTYMSGKPVYNPFIVGVYNITVEGPVVKDQETIITLNGSFPTPCHEIHHHEIQFDVNYHQIIRITLWADSFGTGCIDIVGYFSYELPITIPQNGTWVIICYRRFLIINVTS